MDRGEEEGDMSNSHIIGDPNNSIIGNQSLLNVDSSNNNDLFINNSNNNISICR